MQTEVDLQLVRDSFAKTAVGQSADFGMIGRNLERPMIPRYSRPEMVALWTPQARYEIWLEIETLAAEAMAARGQIPSNVPAAVRARGGFDVERIDEIEREVKHDVIAFLTSVSEHVGEEARYLHKGMTSSDVLDTCLAVQLVRAADLLLGGVDRVLAALKKRAFEHKRTPTIGRSHGIHAEPTTFGVKLAGHFAEFERVRRRLELAREEVATCALSGAVGTFANIDPAIEVEVAKKLGLTPEPVSTQVIPRDRHAAYFCHLAVAASAIERLAVEIRHLQRTEVLEAEEFFSAGQKGSSAMPHKRNPVLTENLTGLARLVRSAAVPALENVALWHERDISHSSVERGIGPDATIHLDFALHRLAGVVENLLVYPANMLANLNRLGGLHNSQRVLLALVEAEVSREDAYRLVQRNAMKVWNDPARGGGDFLRNLKADPDVAARLSDQKLESLFDLDYHFAQVDTIFERVFGAS
jgi:adenylosuccinate lyase